MANANINVRVDAELKRSAEILFEDLGLTMSSAITIFLKSAVKHEGFPFEIRRYAPNAETGATFQKYVMSVYYALNL